MNPELEPGASNPQSRALLLWGTVIVLGGIGLFLAGGGTEDFRARTIPGLPEDLDLPLAIEPEGLLEEPPSRFRWEPGGNPDLLQLVLYDSAFQQIWASRPLPPGTTEWEVPGEAFVDARPGVEHYWRIRQVASGKPYTSSAVVKFLFKVDIHGYGPGEGRPPESRAR